jgi:hypothetical protein
MKPSKPQESALERWERMRKEGQGIGEHILSILKAGLSATPFAGAIASLMSDYIPSFRVRRLEDFASSVAEDFDRLKSQVHEEYLLTEDFAYIFERCLHGAAENPQHEKIDAFRGILINATIRTDIVEEEKEYFLNLVNSLSVLHIRILKFMAAPERYLDEAGIPINTIHGGFGQFFPKAIPGVQLQVIRSAFGELFRYGLVNTDQSIFGTMTSGQGIDLLKGRVTELGGRFISFCMVPR